MKKVILRGPVLSESGYGTHTRQLAKWLLSRQDLDPYFYLVQWGNTPWMLNDEDDDSNLVQRVIQNARPCPAKADISYQVQLPNEWDPTLANYNIGVTAGVETDKCNPQWINACNMMDLIVVPSQHVANTFNASGHLTTPIVVVPESFPDILLQKVPIFDPGIVTDFNFLIFGQLTGMNAFSDRKNTMFAIKWLCEEFANDSSVGIVIKTNSGRESKIDRQITSDVLRKLVSEVRNGPFPKIHLIHGRLSDKQIAGLYNNPKIKALVAPTRGEGFGLPILEASVAGLPVITTGWSGHMDFMSKGRFIKLDYDLKEIHQSRIDDNIFMKGARWAEVNEADFKRKIKKTKQSPDVPRKWAQELSSNLKSSNSHNAISIAWDRTLP